MIRKIIKFPAPSLRAPCKAVAFPITPALLEHIGDLRETLAATPHGVALASNQVLAEGHRVFVVKLGNELPEVVIEPRYDVIRAGGELREVEGCLSIPELSMVNTRHQSVYLRWRGEDGRDYAGAFHGLAARIVQHECDHLDGKLLYDYADRRTQVRVRTEAIKNRKRGK